MPPFSTPVSGDEDEDMHVLKLCTIDADVIEFGEISDAVIVELTSRVLLLLTALSSEHNNNLNQTIYICKTLAIIMKQILRGCKEGKI